MRLNDPEKYTPVLAVGGVVITTAIVWSGRGIKAALKLDLSQRVAAKTDAVSAVMGVVGLLREGFGFTDIVTDIAFVYELSGLRRYTTLFWVALLSLGASVVINCVVSLMFIKVLLTVKPVTKWVAEKGRNKLLLTATVIGSVGRIEGLSLLTAKVGSLETGCPMPQVFADQIAYLGILTPLIEDIRSFIVTALHLKMADEPDSAAVNEEGAATLAEAKAALKRLSPADAKALKKAL